MKVVNQAAIVAITIGFWYAADFMCGFKSPVDPVITRYGFLNQLIGMLAAYATFKNFEAK